MYLPQALGGSPSLSIPHLPSSGPRVEPFPQYPTLTILRPWGGTLPSVSHSFLPQAQGWNPSLSISHLPSSGQGWGNPSLSIPHLPSSGPGAEPFPQYLTLTFLRPRGGTLPSVSHSFLPQAQGWNPSLSISHLPSSGQGWGNPSLSIPHLPSSGPGAEPFPQYLTLTLLMTLGWSPTISIPLLPSSGPGVEPFRRYPTLTFLRPWDRALPAVSHTYLPQALGWTLPSVSHTYLPQALGWSPSLSIPHVPSSGPGGEPFSQYPTLAFLRP